MKKTVSRSRVFQSVSALLLAALLLMLCACGTKADPPASSDSGPAAGEQDYIDLQALEALEKEDVFPLKVTDKSFEKQENQSRDLMKVTVANSGSSTASEINLYYVAYAEDRTMINWRDHEVTYTVENEPYLCTCMPTGGFSIAPGESKEFSVPVADTDSIAGFETIVLAYKSEDGESHINETAKDWELQCVRGRYSLLEDAPSVQATADASKDRINPDAMDAIAARDTFPVRIVRKALYKKLKGVPESKDRCIMTVENGTTEKVKSVTVYAAAYAQDGSLIAFPDQHYKGAWRVGDEIEPGKTVNQNFNVNDIDDIAGICMIVASYKTEDGAEHQNPIFGEWDQVYQTADGTAAAAG